MCACARAVGGDSADFWRSLLPDAVKAAELAEKNRGIVSGPRRRLKVNYNEDKLQKDVEDGGKADVRSPAFPLLLQSSFHHTSLRVPSFFCIWFIILHSRWRVS
jgi:hypothetical protein